MERLLRAARGLVGLVAAVAVVAVLAVAGCSADPGAGHDTSSSTSEQPVTPSSLPKRVVVGYWQWWGDPAVRLRDVPAAYNVVVVAFAVGDSSGRVRFAQQVQSQPSFVADVDALRAAGRRVVLAVGGWNDGGLQIRTEAQLDNFLESVTRIIDANHFEGIDWDLEHGINPERIAEATHRLKAHYGPDFLITMAPILDPPREREQLDLARRVRGVLDMVHPQYYNGGQSDPDWIVDHTMRWVEAVGADRVGMGFMTVDLPTDTGAQMPDQICTMWVDLLERAPHVRGVMVWSVNLDKTSGYTFARTCAKVVLES
jgi:chitinase